jgi:hypothetical protein
MKLKSLFLILGCLRPGVQILDSSWTPQGSFGRAPKR